MMDLLKKKKIGLLSPVLLSLSYYFASVLMAAGSLAATFVLYSLSETDNIHSETTIAFSHH